MGPGVSGVWRVVSRSGASRPPCWALFPPCSWGCLTPALPVEAFSPREARAQKGSGRASPEVSGQPASRSRRTAAGRAGGAGAATNLKGLDFFYHSSRERALAVLRTPLSRRISRRSFMISQHIGRAWQCAVLRRCKSDGKEVVAQPHIQTQPLRPQKTNAATARHPKKAAYCRVQQDCQPYDCASSSKASL